MKWRKLKHASLDDIIGWAEAQPWCQAMANCDQDAEWHSEGDVWTHTKMVLGQLAKLEELEKHTRRPGPGGRGHGGPEGQSLPRRRGPDGSK